MKLKSEGHHWWPECVSRHWAGEDGKTGWLKPDGTCLRIPPARLGVINNGHHIRIAGAEKSSPWDQSFERVFDKADSNFPYLIKWLEGLEHRPVRNVKDLRDRFIHHPCTESELLRMTECGVSLAVRAPMNREASAAIADGLRGPMEAAERNVIIGMNMRNSQRTIADNIGASGKFVAIYSQGKEFVYGDGFFHNIRNAQMPATLPKLFAPITPHVCILICRPTRFMVEPQLSTLVLDDHEVGICNHAVQIYAKNAIYFRSQRPELHEDFRRAAHLKYAELGNPIDSLIHSIPGVPPRNTYFDHLY